MEMATKRDIKSSIKLQPGRALLHTSIGIIALIFGQVLDITDNEKVRVVFWVGGAFTVLDLGLRLPLYYWLVHGGERESKPSRLGALFLTLEKHLLIKPGILRESERGLPTTVVHFTLGILLPLIIGIPMWAVVPAVVIFGFGDPAARLIGMTWGVRKVWKGGMKTWAGEIGYFYVGSIAGLMTVVLQSEFPLYPATLYSLPRVICAVLFTAAVGAHFESMCSKDGTLTSRIVDDNLLVPFVGPVAFYAIMTAGTI